MKSTSTSLFILGFALLTLLSGCGSLTKMRYSRGFKSNLEFNLRKKENRDERQIAAKAVKKQYPKKENKTPDVAQTPLTLETSEETPVTFSVKEEKQSQKNIFSLKGQIKAGQSILPKIKKKQSSVNSGRPIDPTSAAAGVLFYGGLILSILVQLGPLYIPLLSTVAGILIIIGFILAIVGIGKIKRSNHEYSGMGLDISIIVLFSLIILSYLIIIAFLFAFFI